MAIETLLLTLALAGTTAPPGEPDPGASWDQVFEQTPYQEVRLANSFPAYCVERLLAEGRLAAGGKALVLAMGDGRNAIYFAEKGLDVTGLDVSTVALRTAARVAAEKKVALRTVKADLFRHDLGREQWDLVTNIYFNPSIHVIDRIKDAVRPGGYLLIEGYGSEHEGDGPPQWSRYRPNQLLDELKGWRILEYQDGLFPSPWSAEPAVPVVRLLARKP